MPEGDTIRRTANRLRPALVDVEIVRFEAERLVGPTPGAGDSVNRVESKGKYLLIGFSNGQVLETHMMMTGSWHLYRSGERWRRGRRSARVVLEMANGWVAVCFTAPHVQLHREGGRMAQAMRSAHLGPDLCAETFDRDVVVERFGRFASSHTPIGVALLDQRISAGIGNVYKSEVLFACSVHPQTASGAVSGATLLELVETAHRLLRANLDGPGRITVPGVAGGLAVYGRGGQACFTCQTSIVRIVQGEHVRSTYFCPSCQHLAPNTEESPAGPTHTVRDP